MASQTPVLELETTTEFFQQCIEEWAEDKKAEEVQIDQVRKSVRDDRQLQESNTKRQRVSGSWSASSKATPHMNEEGGGKARANDEGGKNKMAKTKEYTDEELEAMIE